MVDIVPQKRLRSNTVRPALSVYNKTWNFFCLKYPIKEQRDKIIEYLIIEQLENEIINVLDIKIDI